MQKRKLLVVDWSNVTHRAWWSSQKDIDIKSWLPVIRFLEMIQTAGRKTGCDEIIFAGESRTPLKRTLIDPTYKSKEKTIDHDFHTFRQACADVIPLMGCSIISIDGYEADDVIASIVAKHCHKCGCAVRCVNCTCADEFITDVYVFSNDKDLYQLLAYDRVYIYKYGDVYTREEFIMEYGFEPKLFEQYKAMVGDPSDGIKGCEGFGPVKATKAILENRVEQEVMLAEQEEEYERALNLVRLEYELDIPIGGQYVVLNSNTSRDSLADVYLEKAVEEINLALIRIVETFNE